MDPSETRTFGDYLRVLKARRRLIVTVALTAAAAALAYSLVRPPVYEATTTVSFTRDFFPQGQTQAPGQAASPAAATGVALVTRSDVLTQASRALGDDPTPPELASAVVADINPESNLATITARTGSAEESAAIVNQVAEEAKVIARQESREYLQRRLGAAAPKHRNTIRQQIAVTEPLEIITPAAVPASPASPQPIRDTVIATVLGLLLGVAVALLRHAVDRRITDPHDAQNELGLPLVGYVPSEVLGVGGIASNGAAIGSEEALEAFRILRANVDFLAEDRWLGTVAVTSPLPEEGKSTVAAGYAYANALAGRPTILVECDFRRPVIANRLGLDPSPGLSDYLMGDARPREILRSVDVEGPTAQPLPVVPAGLRSRQPAELLASPVFEQFIEQISKAYERVVIDCAPLLPVGDALEVLPKVEGVLLCLRLGQTTRDQALAGREAIEHLPERPTGLVITGLERGGENDYYGYYPVTEQPSARA